MKNLKKDFILYKNYSNSFIKAILNHNFHIVLIYRISHFFALKKMQVIARLFWLINRLIFTVDIDPRAKISGGFLIIHGMSIVIGENVKILGQVKLYHGTTLGGNNFKKRIYEGNEISQPIIKNNVVIGINSSILGPCVVEENAVIGTGAIVTKDVLAGSTIVGVNERL